MDAKLIVLTQWDFEGKCRRSFYTENELDTAINDAESMPWGKDYCIEKHQLNDDSLIEVIEPHIHKSGPSRPAKVSRPRKPNCFIDSMNECWVEKEK